MVRAYLLTQAQRDAITAYLKDRPRSMGQSMRALRHRSKQLDLEQIKRDVDLVEQLVNVPMTRGRKPKADSRDQKAGFNVRQGKQ